MGSRESKLESEFQRDLIKELKAIFPGCFIMKNDERLVQGIPDLIILYQNNWAILEVKASWNSARQPNQDYYVDLFNTMSYATYISPENKEEVLDDLTRVLGRRRRRT